jgi:peptidyl-tRNA hydrolase
MIKQVIVVRKDLNMRKGKLAAQVAHASMKVFFDRMTRTSLAEMTRWRGDYNVIDDAYKTTFTEEMI